MDEGTNGVLNPRNLTQQGVPADQTGHGVVSPTAMIDSVRPNFENEYAFGLNFSRDTSSSEAAMLPWADLVLSRRLPLDVLLSDGRNGGPDSEGNGIEDVEYGRTGFGWW